MPSGDNFACAPCVSELPFVNTDSRAHSKNSPRPQKRGVFFWLEMARGSISLRLTPRMRSLEPRNGSSVSGHPSREPCHQVKAANSSLNKGGGGKTPDCEALTFECGTVRAVFPARGIGSLYKSVPGQLNCKDGTSETLRPGEIPSGTSLILVARPLAREIKYAEQRSEKTAGKRKQSWCCQCLSRAFLTPTRINSVMVSVLPISSVSARQAVCSWHTRAALACSIRIPQSEAPSLPSSPLLTG